MVLYVCLGCIAERNLMVSGNMVSLVFVYVLLKESCRVSGNMKIIQICKLVYHRSVNKYIL